MLMNEQEIKNLLDRFEKGDCTPAESALVENWYNQLAQQAKAEITFSELEEKDQEIRSQLFAVPEKRLYPIYLRYAAAVVVIAGLAWGSYGIFTTRNEANTVFQTAQEIQPGSNSAILTLSNGKRISLGTHNGSVDTDPDVQISNNSSNGIVTYKLNNSKTPHVNHIESDQLNTITTPRGGQYQLILSDGTLVYLNADSKLQYSVRFDERVVTLVGEGYFEVAKDAQRPFIVVSQGQKVIVIGTHFNVSCYPEEPIRTTLAEGKIEISQPANSQKATLKPGDQSIVSSNGIKVHQVNPEDAIGWKNGLFVFNRTPLKEVMKQIGRWYDVEVNFNDLPNEPFEGEILRNNTLSQVLKVIERTNDIKFQVEGRRVSIRK